MGEAAFAVRTENEGAARRRHTPWARRYRSRSSIYRRCGRHTLSCLESAAQTERGRRESRRGMPSPRRRRSPPSIAARCGRRKPSASCRRLETRVGHIVIRLARLAVEQKQPLAAPSSAATSKWAAVRAEGQAAPGVRAVGFPRGAPVYDHNPLPLALRPGNATCLLSGLKAMPFSATP